MNKLSRFYQKHRSVIYAIGIGLFGLSALFFIMMLVLGYLSLGTIGLWIAQHSNLILAMSVLLSCSTIILSCSAYFSRLRHNIYPTPEELYPPAPNKNNVRRVRIILPQARKKENPSDNADKGCEKQLEFQQQPVTI